MQAHQLIQIMRGLRMNPVLALQKLSGIFAQMFQKLHKVCDSYANSNSTQTQLESHRKRIKRRYRKQNNSNKNYVPRVKTRNVGNSISQTIQHKRKPKLIKKRRRARYFRSQKDPRPRPPVNQFMLYLRDHQQRLRSSNPNIRPSEIPVLASRDWKQQSIQVINKYKQLYKKKQEDFRSQLGRYYERIHERKHSEKKQTSNVVVQISDSEEKEKNQEEYNFQL